MAETWFEEVDGRELAQGDVVLRYPCATVQFGEELNEGEIAETLVEYYDLIVMSHTCDLVEGREKVGRVVLCAIHDFADLVALADGELATAANRKLLGKNQIGRMQLLPSRDEGDVRRKHSVLMFHQVFTGDLKQLRDHMERQGKRLRMKSPFREFVAQRFGAFFARIALESEIGLPEIKKV